MEISAVQWATWLGEDFSFLYYTLLTYILFTVVSVSMSLFYLLDIKI